MKTLTLLIAALALALVFVNPNALRGRIAPQPSPDNTAAAATSPSTVEKTKLTAQQTEKERLWAPTNPSRPLPQCVVKLANQKGVLPNAKVEELYKETLATMKLWHFRGRVIQHLNDGRLLVELMDWQEKDFPRQQYLAVLNHPQFDTTIDRAVIKIQGYMVGSYTYQSVDGGNRTITEVDCAD